MLAPFGFSVGDFVTVLTLTKDVIAGLQAQGGAVDEFYSVTEDLEANLTIFQRLENHKLPEKYDAQQKSIAALAQSLYGLAIDFLAIVQRYKRDLTRPEARHSYRAVLKKTGWTMKISKRLARFRTEIEAKSLSLRLLLSKVNMSVIPNHTLYITEKPQLTSMHSDISVSVLKASEVSDRAHEHDRQVSGTRHSELLARFERLETSLQSLEAQERIMRLHFHILAQQRQAQPLSVESVTGGRPQTPLLLSSIEQYHDESNLFNSYAHPSLANEAHRDLVLVGRTDSRPAFAQSFHPTRSYAHVEEQLPTTRFGIQHTYNDASAVQDSSPMGLSEASALPSSTAPSNEAAEDESEALRAIGIGIMNVMRALFFLYPQLVFVLSWFRALPAAVPLLTSDDIIFEDFFGTKHNLQYAYFQDWSMVHKMLETRLRGTPGLAKLQHLQYVLEIWEPGKDARHLYKEEWNSVITPRAKVTMAAAFVELKMSVGRCNKCNGMTIRTSHRNFFCSTCRTTYRTWISANKYVIAKMLQQAKHRSGVFLNDPRPISDLHSREYEDYTYRHVVLRYRIEYRHRKKWAPLPLRATGATKDKEPTRRTWIPDNLPRLVDGEGNVAEVFKSLRPQLTQTKNRIRGNPARWPDADTHERLIAEMEELNMFHRVTLREDAPLHSAAMLGNEARVRSLLQNVADPDAERGIWGTPLNAAVLSGSLQVVSLLLEHGASPLKALVGLPTPTESAALKGHKSILDMLLTRALKILGLELLDPHGYQATNVSRRRNEALRKIFNDLLDSALYSATKENQLGTVQLLLFYGANPYCKSVGSRSPFRTACIQGNVEIIKIFIVETTARSLLSLEEAYELLITPLNSTFIEDGMEERMRRRSKWHYPYVRSMSFAEHADLDKLNREYSAWAASDISASPRPIFEVPEILVTPDDTSMHKDGALLQTQTVPFRE